MRKDGIVRETVGKFFDAAGDFAIFKVTQVAIKIANLLLGILHEVADLFRRETHPPQHALIAFAGKRLIKHGETLRALE